MNTELSPPPSGRTARRLEWQFLPAHIRGLVEGHCGSPVTGAVSQGGGFTPGFASVLTCADGTQHFVKAASVKAQRMFALSYREEARKLLALQDDVPAPRLLWTHDDDDWVVLGIEHVDGQLPTRPWQPDHLDRLLDALEQVVEVTPPPELGLAPVTDDLAAWPAYWDTVRANHPDLTHADEAAGLAARFPEALAGSTLQHTDIRDDNTLLGSDGELWICDWSWPVLAAPWFDTLAALIGPRGDGIDVEAVLASRALTRDVPAEHLDIALALFAGYFLKSADDPVPPSSPHIRHAQAWQGQVVWGWLCERRGWDC
ncbi:phosphotransferase [Nocardioides sp. JQ2195]|uniref:phosphotransferase family protein n=1 Tax=Nocardioides sp. JQ2195 TaxID=2592334 RepID=UPI00143ED88E|nr:phosphotransferase [Nocardioides sp. JQ2195]QIX27367.1 phosphotransferase [Nocardioides sp. JQ2195]